MATVYEIEKTATVDKVLEKLLLETRYRDDTTGSYGQRFYEMLRPPPR
jgi:hypothetical protein